MDPTRACPGLWKPASLRQLSLPLPHFLSLCFQGLATLLLFAYLLPCPGCTQALLLVQEPTWWPPPSSKWSLAQSQFAGDRLWPAQLLVGQLLTSVQSTVVGGSLGNEQRRHGYGHTSDHFRRSLGRLVPLQVSCVHSLLLVNTWQMSKENHPCFPSSFSMATKAGFELWCFGLLKLWSLQYTQRTYQFSQHRADKSSFYSGVMPLTQFLTHPK